MYIFKLSEDDVIKFVKQILKKKYSQYKQMEIVKSTYSRHTDHQRLLLVVRMDGKLISFTVEVSDYYCKIYNDSTSPDPFIIKKAWGKHVCDILQKQASTPGAFSPDNYKKKYNAYWQKVKDAEVAKAVNEFNKNSL